MGDWRRPGHLRRILRLELWLGRRRHCIEGLAVVAEEAKDPTRTIPRGYLSAILTLVLLAFGVVILTAGVGDPRRLATIDYPLLAALATVLGAEHDVTRLFAGIGLFGLIRPASSARSRAL